MTLDVDTLMQAGASDDYLAKLLAVAGALGLSTTSWQEGDPTLTIYESISDVLASRDSAVETPIVKGLLLDFAADPSVTPEPVRGVIYQGGWLDLTADQLFSTYRLPATRATVGLMFTNSTGITLTYPAGTYHVQDAAGASTYSNVDDLTVPTGISGPFVAQCDTVGGGQVAPTQPVAPVVNLTMSIASGSFSQGVDTESNANLVARSRGKFKTFSLGGPSGAYDYIARSIPVETPAVVSSGLRMVPASPVTRTMKVPATGGPLATPDVTLYVACASGEYDAAEQYTDAVSMVIDAAVPNILGYVTITTHTNHGYTSGDNVCVRGLGGIVGADNTAANPTWPITKTGDATFTVPASATGSYTSGGTCYRVSDLDLVKRNLQYYVVPDGILLDLRSAVADNLTVEWGIEVRAAGANQALVTKINAAITTFLQSIIPIGGVPVIGGNGVPFSAIIGTIWQQDPTNIVGAHVKLAGVLDTDWVMSGASSVVNLTSLTPTLISDSARIVVLP